MDEFFYKKLRDAFVLAEAQQFEEFCRPEVIALAVNLEKFLRKYHNRAVADSVSDACAGFRSDAQFVEIVLRRKNEAPSYKKFAVMRALVCAMDLLRLAGLNGVDATDTEKQSLSE